MTLVVGKIVGNKIFIESDSKITDQNLVRSNPLCGLLKTLILHPFVCVSFAGNVDFAQEVFRVIFEKMIKSDWNIDLLLKILLKAHRDSTQKTDFAVASIVAKKPSLFKIFNGYVQKDISNFWLGDHQGFEFYQTAFHTIKEKLPEEERMRKAFKKVIDEEKLITIGDFHISTYLDYSNPTYPVFLYHKKAEFNVSEPQLIKFEKAGEQKIIPIGTTAGGAYSISYFTTVDTENHGVAIHFFHGNFGIFFCPRLSIEKGIIINNVVNGVEFATEIKKRYGIPLQGFVVRSDGGIQYIDNRDAINTMKTFK